MVLRLWRRRPSLGCSRVPNLSGQKAVKGQKRRRSPRVRRAKPAQTGRSSELTRRPFRMAPVVPMMLLPEKDLGPLAVQTVRSGLVTQVLLGTTAPLVERTVRMALVVPLPTEDLDITTDEKVRVGRRAPAALMVLDPMPGHMVRVGRKVAGKSPKTDLGHRANQISTTRRPIAQSSRDRWLTRPPRGWCVGVCYSPAPHSPSLMKKCGEADAAMPSRCLSLRDRDSGTWRCPASKPCRADFAQPSRGNRTPPLG